MKRWLKKTEVIVDKIVPYCLILLLFIILGEIFFHYELEPYHNVILTIDFVIIGIFLVDLSFKYHHSKDVPYFLKHYWIDIIAVFPFFLIIRIIEEFAAVARIGHIGQATIHEAVEGAKILSESEKATKALQEAERLSKVSRTSRFARFFRPIARIPRLVKAMHFFEHPKHRAAP